MCIKRMVTKVKTKYSQHLTKKYYRKKVREFKKDNKNWIGKTCDIVFLGDSITDYCDLNKYYSGYSFVNRGIGGDSTTGVLKRMEISVYFFKPKVVVLLIGTNNYYDMENDYEDIIKEINQNCPNTKIILLSLLCARENYAYLNSHTIERNKYIKKIAEKYGYDFVDVRTPLEDADGQLKKEYTVDNIHLSHDGYLQITPLIDSTIKKNLQQDNMN